MIWTVQGILALVSIVVGFELLSPESQFQLQVLVALIAAAGVAVATSGNLLKPQSGVE